MKLSALVRENRVLFRVYFVLLLVVGGLMLAYTKEELIRFVNDHNSLTGDALFPYLTYLGDGAVVLALGVLLLLINRSLGGMLLVSFAMSGLVSLFLKLVVFPERLRPLRYFEHSNWEYHIIKGLKINEYNSFPSGHTTSAFALFVLLGLLWRHKAWNGLWLLPAVVAGYSRVYLFQHFVEDAFTGSIIGTATAVGVYLAYQKRFGTPPKLG